MNAPTSTEARVLGERAWRETHDPDALMLAVDLTLRAYRMAAYEAPRRWTATGRDLWEDTTNA
jgi:hypothetical protein